MFSSSPSGQQREHAIDVPARDERGRKFHPSVQRLFVPDDPTLNALVAAAKRGGRISIVTPGEHIDAETVRRASRARWGRLLEADIELYEYQPTMYHCKVMIVDELWVSAGSTNFDSRSFALNDEANLNIFDASFAERQVAIFEQDIALSRVISLSEWQHGPFSEKFMDRLASLLRLQL